MTCGIGVLHDTFVIRLRGVGYGGYHVCYAQITIPHVEGIFWRHVRCEQTRYVETMGISCCAKMSSAVNEPT